MVNVFDVADVLVNHAVAAHGDEIAIIAYYGSYATGSASATSDLDMFYIPDKGKAGSLYSSFVLDGLPFEFWPVGWELAQRIAGAEWHWPVSAAITAHAQVLYARSEDDRQRFEALREETLRWQAPEQRQAMIKRALDTFKAALFHLGNVNLALLTDSLTDVRWAAWNAANAAVECLALVNQTYFTKGWGANLSQALAMPRRPDALGAWVEAVATSPEASAVAGAAQALVYATRGILREAQEEVGSPRGIEAVFKDFYAGIYEYTNKVQSACEREDPVGASFAAALLQNDLALMMAEAQDGAPYGEFNLYGEYGAHYDASPFASLMAAAAGGDCAEMAARADALDGRSQAWLAAQGLALYKMETLEELRQYLQARDPVPGEGDEAE